VRDRGRHVVIHDRLYRLRRLGKYRLGVPGAPYQLVDPDGNPVLSAEGRNFNWNAGAILRTRAHRFTFPVRWKKALTQSKRFAVMSAIDDTGSAFAHYRRVTPSGSRSNQTEMVVGSDAPLSDELIILLAMSAGQIDSYFRTPDGGGG
jgi:hypothetical protein